MRMSGWQGREGISWALTERDAVFCLDSSHSSGPSWHRDVICKRHEAIEALQEVDLRARKAASGMAREQRMPLPEGTRTFNLIVARESYA